MGGQTDPAPQVAHAPHAPLTAYYSSEQERAGFVRRLFDSTAADYDRMERILGNAKGTAVLWRYYRDTIEACVPPSQVLATLEAAGFAGVRRHIETSGLSMLAEYQAGKPG